MLLVELVWFVAFLLPGFISLAIIRRMFLIKDLRDSEYYFWSVFLSIITVMIYFSLFGDLQPVITSDNKLDLVAFSRLSFALIIISMPVGIIGTPILRLFDDKVLEEIRKRLQKNYKIQRHRESILDYLMIKPKYLVITTKDGLRYAGNIKRSGGLIDEGRKMALYLENPQLVNEEFVSEEHLKLSKLMKDRKIEGVVILEDEISTIEISE